MLVYRITQTKYAGSLDSPGFYARWNSESVKMLYTGGSAALSCLEVAVHKSGASLTSGNFSLSILEVPDSLVVHEILISELEGLNNEWYKPANSNLTQTIGDEWINSKRSCILRVPSAIIQNEFNYLLNINHPDFSQIRIKGINPFIFDPRLKTDPGA